VSWNYRVFLVSKSIPQGRGKKALVERWLEIREAHYYRKGNRKPTQWMQEAVTVSGEDLEWVLEAMQAALSKPVLCAETGKEVGSHDEVKRRLAEEVDADDEEAVTARQDKRGTHDAAF
jgi:hypothetical protein